MSNKYIIDQGDHWRVKIRIGKEFHNRCFGFANYGGKRFALDEAIEWRNKTLKDHGLLYRLRFAKAPDLFRHKSKTTPIIGVYQSVNRKGNRNWTARFNDEKKHHFSINLYGEKKAFLMACEQRFKHCGRLKIVRPKLMPCKVPPEWI